MRKMPWASLPDSYFTIAPPSVGPAQLMMTMGAHSKTRQHAPEMHKGFRKGCFFKKKDTHTKELHPDEDTQLGPHTYLKTRHHKAASSQATHVCINNRGAQEMKWLLTDFELVIDTHTWLQFLFYFIVIFIISLNLKLTCKHRSTHRFLLHKRI